MARQYGAGVATGIAVSLVAALFRPIWLPAVIRWGRPATKAAFKQGVLAYELGRERLAELGESVSDLMAEAQMELAAERAASEAATVNSAQGAAPTGAE